MRNVMTSVACKEVIYLFILYRSHVLTPRSILSLKMADCLQSCTRLRMRRGRCRRGQRSLRK